MSLKKQLWKKIKRKRTPGNYIKNYETEICNYNAKINLLKDIINFINLKSNELKTE